MSVAALIMWSPARLVQFLCQKEHHFSGDYEGLVALILRTIHQPAAPK
jgi:hypothetical protein